MAKVIGKVTEEERDEIQALFERKNGLAELSKILTPDNSMMYERLVQDMGRTQTEFQRWWDLMSKKYAWENTEGGSWSIDFDTCEITLSDSLL